MHHGKILKTLSLGALALAGCGDTGPSGPQATQLTLTVSSAYIWPYLCKKIAIQFFDDSGNPQRWGRDEALRLTISNAVAYGDQKCSGAFINNLYLGPENKQATLWIKPTAVGTVSVSVSGSGSIGATTTLTAENRATAKLVLGQSSFSGVSSGAGLGAMNSPQAIAVCGTKLFVADSFNNRVLGWNTIPSASNTAADFALTTTGGGGIAISNPTGVACTSDTLYVMDGANARILGYSPIPNAGTATPTIVWGSSGVAAAGNVTSTSQNNTVAGTLDVSGTSLVVSNRTWHRALFWNTAPTAWANLPDYVLGQAGFGTASSGSSLAQFNEVTDARLRSGYLITSEYGNNRVLLFNTLATGATAFRVLGRDTSASTTYAGTVLKLPLSADYDGDHLIVADSGNNRMLIWNGLPDSDNQSADLAIGAPSDFTDQGTGTAADYTGNYNWFTIGGGYLWVAESSYNRVTAYPAP